MRISLYLLLVAPALAQEAENPLPRGERLISEFNCIACHRADEVVAERLAPQLAPRLDDVASRVHPDYLRAYLEDPSGTNPMGRMPDQLAHLSADDRAQAVDALTHFLMGLGEPMDRSPRAAHLSAIERGRRTFHEVGCVACHRPQEELWELDWTLAELFAEQEDGGGDDDEPVEIEDDDEDEEFFIPAGTLPHPDVPLELDWIAGKTTIDALTAFLLDPVAVRPSGRMPDLGLEQKQARDVAQYLLRGQTSLGEWRYEEAEGLNYEYFEDAFPQLPVDWDGLSAKRTGSTGSFDIAERDRDDFFGFRWRGMIDVPEDGTYEFWTTSDDGSHLFIDGEHVVNNGDIHGNKTVGGTIELDAGRHALEATFFERAGGESMKVEWAGPDIPRGTIPASLLSHAALVYRAGDEPFERHEAKAKRGAQLFLDLGCATCHMTGDPAIDGQSPVAATPLAKLAGQRGAGCLSGDRPRIRFDREGDQEAVRGLLGKVGSLGLPLDHETAVAYTLDRMNCYACHQRKDFGGTHPKVAGYFGADEGAELGDEGRIPPHLSQVGAKLTSAWLQEVLLHGGTSRPYMHTRMPQFGADNVGHLVDLFPRADPPAPERKDWDISPDILADGHTLVGKGHLGCVQCHTFGGQRSLGVQAVDLTTMVDRIRYPWFRELMRDPKALNMDTRMPSFWPDGESPSPLLEGDPDQQIEAVWAFLSLGEGMAVPAGIATSATAFELVPAEEPLMAGVFMQDVSPRTLVVGFPERVHYAYDMQNSRVAKLWRGRFFNTKGTWDGRAGQLELPPSDQVLDLPPGPAFARLADIGADWPMAAPRPLGRKLTPERVPVLRYAIGHVTIEERLEPELRFGGSILKRHITVSSDGPVSNLYFRPFAWSSGGDQWSAPEKLEGGALRYGALSPAVELKLDGAATPTAVVGTGVDLRIPVQLVATASGYRASFTVEVSW